MVRQKMIIRKLLVPGSGVLCLQGIVVVDCMKQIFDFSGDEEGDECLCLVSPLCLIPCFLPFKPPALPSCLSYRY